MQYYLRFLFMVNLLVLCWVVACDEKTTEPEAHPLVGVWELSEMEQTIILTTTEDYSQLIGYSEGETIADTTITWEVYQQLGVAFSIDLKADNSYTLTGNLPAASDTLGMPPMMIQLTDQGSWSATDNLTSFTLDGNFYSLSGELSADDPDNPGRISIFYTQAGDETVYFPVDTDQDQKPDSFFEISVYDSTATTVQFTRG